jgi:TLD
MGGQFEYFGFWLDQLYGTGHSKAQPKCTTYKSPQLSAKPQFAIRTIEVWAVGPDSQSANADETDQVCGSLTTGNQVAMSLGAQAISC